MKRIEKVVITAAGTGTRLLPFTKEMPKEMLPIFTSTKSHKLILKPILQEIYESVYDYGIKNFCFVVGKGKRSIEDHFLMSKTDKNILNDFYHKISKTNIFYVQQHNPNGFGDAVSKAEKFVGNENFLLHAGDDIILSKNNDHLRRLERAFFKHDADLAFLITEIENPSQYGVITGNEIEKDVILAKDLEEKPKKPKSHMAIIATYIFKPKIFEELKRTKPDKNGEIQLATAVKNIIKNGNSVGVKLKKSEKRLDVGTPENYINCINNSFKNSIN